MGDKSIFVLGVALITWGGVFGYLLKLDASVKKLENQLKAEEKTRDDETTASHRLES